MGTRQGARQDGECRAHLGAARGLGEPVWVVTGLSGVPGVDQIFMRESDAWDFLRKRSKRSSKSREEVAGKGAAGPLGQAAGCPGGCSWDGNPALPGLRVAALTDWAAGVRKRRC